MTAIETYAREPVRLDHPDALDPALTGRKAAALARAAAHGLPVLPGVVLPTGAAALETGASENDFVRHLPLPWIARSSSPDEDGEHSSQAGRFRSVRDITDPAALPGAVDAVRESAGGAPMAVLIQPQLDFTLAGVLFGVDPVSGTPGLVVAMTTGSPELLVSGAVDGDTYALSRRGGFTPRGPDPRLGRALATLAADTSRLFGGPQDIEWGWTGSGGLVLLQSRPVTRIAAPVPRGARLLGAGPLAETFPEPLWPLEEDLWLPALRTGLARALRATGGARGVPAEDVVRSVRGHAVADLAALGAVPGRRRWTALLDPRPGMRRLRASWRVGRLRAALPETATGLLRRTDALLTEVPPAPELTDAQLVALVDRSGPLLAAVHEHEALMGLLLGDTAPAVTGAGLALRILTEAPPGTGAAELARREPVLLALVPPSIAMPRWPTVGGAALGGSVPAAAPTAPIAPAAASVSETQDTPAVLREALRLRARWIQELQATAARELGLRLAAAGRLPDTLAVRTLHLDELLTLLRNPAQPWTARPGREPDPTPLPDTFRLAGDGTPVAAVDTARAPRDGTGASPGRATGTVVHDPAQLDTLPEGTGVLVVRTLAPGLAVHLPRLAGLVAQTGSPLSHLAILAREYGVPAVVALPGALDRHVPGASVVVDGRAGTVTPATTLGKAA